MKKFLIACLMLSASAVSLAKLPPLSDEAKAKAAEAAAKTAWAGKVDGYALCKAQDKAAAKTAKSGKAGKATATPPCADPGPFVYTPAVAGAPAAKAPAAPAAAPAAPAPAAPAKKS
jgi:hypothetical protein